jgi:AsmA-like protein
MKGLRLGLLLAVALILAGGLLAPFLKADRYRPKIQAALEAALNRHVEIGAVRLNLFTGPGFTLKDVLIDDDPSAGIEPFAHVESLEARVKLTSLLRGRLAFSNLRLVEPSVNLVQTEAGPWNIAALLDQTPSVPAGGHTHSVPDIEISDGRLNLKFGDTKSIFYVSNADVEIYPNSNGDVVIRFSGEPARTDRSGQGFGRLTARGLLRATTNGEDQLNLGLHLERTSISDLMTLFYGRDIGVHGYALANANLAGPLSRLDIGGDLSLYDVHRWDLMPAKGEAWNLNLRGSLNVRGQQLELETTPARQPLPVSVKLRVANYLSAPKWAAFVTIQDLAAASFVDAARHMGAPLPAGIQVDGKVQGAIGYARDNGIQGTLSIEHASLRLAQTVKAEFDSLPLVISNNEVAFGPAELRAADNETAQVEGHYALNNGSVGLRVSSRQLTIAEIESGATGLLDANPIPVLERLRKGTFKGWLEFERHDDRPAVWTGEYDVQNATLDVAGIAAPLRVSSATVTMDAEQVRISRLRGRAGNIRIEADYRFDLAGTRPHALQLVMPEAQLADLERVMLPTLRRQEGFLARAFRLRPPPLPPWLKERALEGSVQINNLLYGDAPLGVFRARLKWNGARIQLTNAECRREDMRAAGELAVNLSSAAPEYRISGRIDNMDYRGGQLDLEGDLNTSGIASDLLLNARGDGEFGGRGIDLGPDAEGLDITGAYHLDATAGIPRLQLQNVEVTQGSDTLMGQGTSQADGRIVLELTSGRKQVRMTGMLFPARPEPSAAR